MIILAEPMISFKDRIEAGEKLAVEVVKQVKDKDGLVLGIPRGGVVVAKIVADKLGWPLKTLPAKKIGAPGNPEFAIGAKVASTDLKVKGINVVLIDDGIATGNTIQAGVEWLRQHGAKRVMAAVPVAAKDSAERLRPLVDEWVCLLEPENLYAVGQFYQEFGQVSDAEVVKLLQ